MDGTKIHTIREDKHKRWKKGRLIHFATGIRSKNYNQFYEKVCTGVQNIQIDPVSESIKVDNKILNHRDIQKIILNDGFQTRKEFWDWFNEPFKGRLIHWTSFKY